MGLPHQPLPAPPRASLADALFPKVRQRVLAVLFDAPQRSFYMGEVIALAQSGTGAVQRELADLAAAGILNVHKQGKQKHFQANTQSPIFKSLHTLVSKTMGARNVLTSALAPVARQVSAAYMLNSPATTTSNTKAPVITVVLFGRQLSDTAVAGAVADALQDASNTLARQVKFSVHTPETLASAMAQNDQFLLRLLRPSKTWLKGSEDNLFGKAT
jgi:hypothetical protein